MWVQQGLCMFAFLNLAVQLSSHIPPRKAIWPVVPTVMSRLEQPYTLSRGPAGSTMTCRG